MVYVQLRRLAGSFIRRERPGVTIQATAPIHEAYLQLVREDRDFQGRAHFSGVAARIMRQIPITDARRHRAQKRGGGNCVDTADEAPIPAQESEGLPAAHEALDRLALRDERKAKVIELKYFGGLTGRNRPLVGLTLDPFWSHDGRYVYFQDVLANEDKPIFRVRIRDRRIERLMNARQIPQSEVAG